jgi:hypothetical protein
MSGLDRQLLRRYVADLGLTWPTAPDLKDFKAVEREGTWGVTTIAMGWLWLWMPSEQTSEVIDSLPPEHRARAAVILCAVTSSAGGYWGA